MTDFLGGLKLAEGYNAEGRHVPHFTETVAVMRERQLAFTRLSSAARAGLDMGAAFALAALVWFALSTTALPLPELLLVAVIFARLLPARFRLQQHFALQFDETGFLKFLQQNRHVPQAGVRVDLELLAQRRDDGAHRHRAFVAAVKELPDPQAGVP